MIAMLLRADSERWFEMMEPREKGMRMLAYGEYFSFSWAEGDESQLFLKISQRQVRTVEDGVIVCIPMDLWVVMHSLGVPRFELATVTDEVLLEQAEREVAARIERRNTAETSQEILSVGASEIGEFGSMLLPAQEQVARRMGYLKAAREIQYAILESSLEHVNHAALASFKTL
jgi:hypothetical protein